SPTPSVIYLVPSLLAARTGGLPLVFGMTIVAGLFEMALSRGLRRLRPIFPPEIIGLVILLVGIATGLVALKVAFGDRGGDPGPLELGIGLFTLSLMVGLYIWGTGYLRIFCVLIGMIAGYFVADLMGIISAADMATIKAMDLVAFPHFSHISWAFDPALAI